VYFFSRRVSYAGASSDCFAFEIFAYKRGSREFFSRPVLSDGGRACRRHVS